MSLSTEGVIVTGFLFELSADDVAVKTAAAVLFPSCLAADIDENMCKGRSICVWSSLTTCVAFIFVFAKKRQKKTKSCRKTNSKTVCKKF